MVAAGASAALVEYLALKGKAGARASADNLIQKLTAELIGVRGELQRARELQSALINALGADTEVSRREALARPVLAAEVAGLTVERTQKLIRNVALHAKQCPSGDAPLTEWRQAQKGPRLGGGGPERSEGHSFIPMVCKLLEGQGDCPPRALSGGCVWQSAVLECFLVPKAGRQTNELRADAAEFRPPPQRPALPGGHVLRAGVAEFIPGAGRWHPIDVRSSSEGLRCSCGAVVFSSVPVGAVPAVHHIVQNLRYIREIELQYSVRSDGQSRQPFSHKRARLDYIRDISSQYTVDHS